MSRNSIFNRFITEYRILPRDGRKRTVRGYINAAITERPERKKVNNY